MSILCGCVTERAKNDAWIYVKGFIKQYKTILPLGVT